MYSTTSGVMMFYVTSKYNNAILTSIFRCEGTLRAFLIFIAPAATKGLLSVKSRQQALSFSLMRTNMNLLFGRIPAYLCWAKEIIRLFL